MSPMSKLLIALILLAGLAGCAIVPAHRSYYSPYYSPGVVRPVPYYTPHYGHGFYGHHYWR